MIGNQRRRRPRRRQRRRRRTPSTGENQVEMELSTRGHQVEHNKDRGTARIHQQDTKGRTAECRTASPSLRPSPIPTTSTSDARTKDLKDKTPNPILSPSSNHHVQITTSKSPRPDHHVQITTSKSPRPDHHVQITTSKSPRPNHQVQIAKYKSPSPDRQVKSPSPKHQVQIDN